VNSARFQVYECTKKSFGFKDCLQKAKGEEKAAAGNLK